MKCELSGSCQQILIKDDWNWLTLNLQWIQAAAHKKMFIYMLLNKPCMLLNKPYKFHWSKERLVWEIREIRMRTNRLIFTLFTLGTEWIKFWEWAKWPRKGSPWYLRSVWFYWFVTLGLKTLSVNQICQPSRFRWKNLSRFGSFDLSPAWFLKLCGKSQFFRYTH